MPKFNNNIRRNIRNIPGWRTGKQIVVLESDDWGSIRMPSSDVYEKLQDCGIDLISDKGARFNKYDALATSADLSELFEVLSSVKDITGRSAVLTPVSVVANPDFKRILDNNFSEYFFEPFTDTLRKCRGCEDAFMLWKEGIQKRLFVPQFHGREHLNIMVWMKALKEGNTKAKEAFRHGFWGLSTQNDPKISVEFQAAFDFIDPSDLAYQKEVITTGLMLFRNLFGYYASYFVPPNGPFSSRLEPLLKEHVIKYIALPRLRLEPIGLGKTKISLNWLGRRTSSGLTVITRNCFFEPVMPGKDWVDSCLSDISIAFRWQKPAIISSHRVNFMGSLSASNRKNGLKQLGYLLKSIIHKWPKVQFYTTDELGHIMNHD